MPLTEAQLAQRRAAARSRGKQLREDVEHQRRASRSLREKVGVAYYRFIAERGGRKRMYLLMMEVAESWQFTEDEIAASKVSEERRAELVAQMRQHYRERAEEKYGSPVGYEGRQKVMLEMFPPDQAKPKSKRKRKSKKGKSNE
jgi:hypothetical protein